MRRELSKSDVERLFVAAVDGVLAGADASTFEAELEADAELKARYERYQRAVGLLQAAPREHAPDALASVVLRRARRRRFSLRAADLHLAYRLPAEVVIPLLVAVLVAMFMVLASP